MTKELKLHKIQSAILVDLLLSSGKRFAQLNKKKISTDKFTFHIQKLVSEGLIFKNIDGLYLLTTEGKEFANRFDTKAKVIERQAKIGILICCTREKRGFREFLLQQRLKQPYYGFWGFITGKIRWGDGILETARRELKEETGLMAKLELAGIKHKTDYDSKGILLEDKFFFVMKAKNPKGKLKNFFEGGKNKWFKKEEIFKQKDLFPDIEKTLQMSDSDQLMFSEFKFKVDKY
jgi:8-oxo-dGTP pyrophosphatase MutT (NUDIX family)